MENSSIGAVLEVETTYESDKPPGSDSIVQPTGQSVSASEQPSGSNVGPPAGSCCSVSAPPDEVNWLPSSFQLMSKSDMFITGLVSCEAELANVLECHSKATLTMFVSWCDDKKKNTDKNKRLLWQTEDISDNVPLTVVRRKILICEHGKDYHKKKQLEPQDGVNSNVRKRRSCNQKTKKVNCPAKIFIRHITRYDDFKVAAQTSKKKREKTIQQLKERISKNQIKGIDVIHVKLPLLPAHENHTASEESAFSRSIHPSIKEEIFDSVSQGITSVPLLKKKIKQFVRMTLCPPGTEQPHAGDRRYFPTSRTIKNQVLLALQAEKVSDCDRTNLEEKIKMWQKADPNSFFSFRKSTERNNQEVSKAQRLLRDNLKKLSDLSFLSADVNGLKKAAESVKEATNFLKSTVVVSSDLAVHRCNVTKLGLRELPNGKKHRTKKRKHLSDDKDDPPISNKKPKVSAGSKSTLQKNELSSVAVEPNTVEGIKESTGIWVVPSVTD